MSTTRFTTQISRGGLHLTSLPLKGPDLKGHERSVRAAGRLQSAMVLILPSRTLLDHDLAHDCDEGVFRHLLPVKTDLCDARFAQRQRGPVVKVIQNLIANLGAAVDVVRRDIRGKADYLNRRTTLAVASRAVGSNGDAEGDVNLDSVRDRHDNRFAVARNDSDSRFFVYPQGAVTGQRQDDSGQCQQGCGAPLQFFLLLVFS